MKKIKYQHKMKNNKETTKLVFIIPKTWTNFEMLFCCMEQFIKHELLFIYFSPLCVVQMWPRADTDYNQGLSWQTFVLRLDRGNYTKDRKTPSLVHIATKSLIWKLSCFPNSNIFQKHLSIFGKNQNSICKMS